MAQKFLTNVELEAGLVDSSNSTGTSGFLLSSTGTATSWVDPAAVSVGESEQVHIACKNTSGVAISKGDPVYITGTVGTSFRIEIAAADASNSAKMPAVGLAETDLGINAEGFVIVSGVLKNLTTDPLSTGDGTPSSNDTVYVKAGGGLTRTKPTGSGNLIQNVGKVGRVNSANAGSLAVSTIMRTNDVPNLTTGKIWVGSPTYTTESTVVHLDETNNRLGVNQTSPIGAVHILGPNTNPAMTTSALVVEQGDGAKILIDGNDIDAAAGMLYLNDYSTNDVVFGGQIRVGGGGSPVGNSWFANGNVGIGTTSPDYKLEVSGALGVSRTDGIIFAGSAGTGTGSKIASNTSNDLIFSTALASSPYTTTERVRVLNNGFVGIGTTSPTSLLTLESNNPYPRIDIKSTSYYPGSEIRFLNSAGSEVSVIESYSNPGREDITMRYTLSSTGGKCELQDNAAILGAGTSAVQSYLQVGITDFRVITNYGTRMYINTLGNVGIGTTSPSGRLTIGSGATTDNSTMFNVNGQYNDVGFNGGTSGLLTQGVWSFINSATWDQTRFYVQDQNNVASRLTFDFRGNAGNTNILAGTSTGNVGVGTTSPAYKLDVNGSIASSVSSGFPELRLSDAVSDFLITTNSNGEGIIKTEGTSKNIRFFNNSGETMRISGAGDVGIGTTSPVTKLDVEGSIRGTRYLYLKDTSGTNRLTIQAESTYVTHSIGALAQNFVANYYRFYDDTLSEMMRIADNGNVGIGTTSPGTRLDVVGDITASGKIYATSFVQTSQRDQKTEIELLGKETTSIPIKRYKYKSGDNDKLRYGVVAEDIESNYPELVDTDSKGIKGVRYIDLLVRKIAELETEKRTLVNWRHYHSNTSYNMLYDTGMTTAFPYAYGSIPAPYDMYFTSFTLVNNPYSSYNKGPEGDTAIVQAYVNNTLVHEIRDIRYGNNPFESITVDFGQNVALRQGQALQIRFQANGAWRYCNSTIILTEK